jgi:acyl-CoA hydrolase
MQAIHAGAVVLAHINPMLPRTRGPFIPVSRINAWAQAALPPLSIALGTRNPALKAVATQVAQLVSDGDTLQFGLGRLQAEVLAALTSHRHLKVHSGMVSDALLDLIESGSLLSPSMHSPPVCTGMAIGSAALYQAVSDPCLVQFSPVSHTHAHATLAGLPHLKAINSALEIDLLGQVNCATLKGRQVSGIGGLVDLTRGARASQGGMGIVAATALAGRAHQSRIVPMLDPSAVSMSRSDVDTVVTEHGAAHLRHLGLDDRAHALIAIAAPEHREHLHQAWRTLRRNL